MAGQSIEGKRVLCVGDIAIDYLVAVERLPELGDKVAGRRLARAVGGMAANVSVGLARLGTPSRLIAVLGDDWEGDLAHAAVAGERIDASQNIRRPGVETFACFVFVTPGGERSLVRLESEAYLPRVEDVEPAAFEDVAHLHLTFASPALTMHCLRLASERGITASLDLEAADLPANAELVRTALALVAILFVNRRSHQQLLHLLDEDRVTGPELVVTTLGPQGSRIESEGGSPIAPGFSVSTKDTTGAGDAFAAGFIHRFLDKAPPEDALRFANAAGALACLQLGAQSGLPSEAEIGRFLRNQRGAHRHAAAPG